MTRIGDYAFDDDDGTPSPQQTADADAVQKFAGRLRKQMARHHLSQSDVAREMTVRSGNPVSRAVVSNWCRGLHFPRQAQLDLLAEVIDTTVPVLVRGLSEPSAADVRVVQQAAFDVLNLSVVGEQARIQIDRMVPLTLALEIMKLLAGYSGPSPLAPE